MIIVGFLGGSNLTKCQTLIIHAVTSISVLCSTFNIALYKTFTPYLISIEYVKSNKKMNIKNTESSAPTIGYIILYR